MLRDTPSFGVYVHVPFCAKRCDYCAFATWTDRMHLVEAYLDACVVDLGPTVLRAETAAIAAGLLLAALRSGLVDRHVG